MLNRIGFPAITATEDTDAYYINAAITSAGTVGESSVRIGERNIALADLDDEYTSDGYRAICVCVESGTLSETVTTLANKKMFLADVGDYTSILYEPMVDDIPAGVIVINTAHLAINADGDLICREVAGAIEDEDVVQWGCNKIRVVMIDGLWCLSVVERV